MLCYGTRMDINILLTYLLKISLTRFMALVLIYTPWNISENQSFPDVSRGHRKTSSTMKCFKSLWSISLQLFREGLMNCVVQIIKCEDTINLFPNILSENSFTGLVELSILLLESEFLTAFLFLKNYFNLYQIFILGWSTSFSLLNQWSIKAFRNLKGKKLVLLRQVY